MSDELSPSQAAARIGATTRSVQRWIASGRLPARRVGGRWRVATDAIDAFVASDGTRDGEPAADHHADPDPVHRQPGRDRDTDHADVRPPRDPGDRPGHGRPGRPRPARHRRGRRRLRGPPERTPSTRVSASWPRTRTSPRRSGPPGSAGSGRRRLRSGRWATRLPRVGWPPRSTSRSSPATTTRTSPTRHCSRRRTGSASRCWSSRRPAAVARACGPFASRTGWPRRSEPRGARPPRPSATTG